MQSVRLISHEWLPPRQERLATAQESRVTRHPYDRLANEHCRMQIPLDGVGQWHHHSQSVHAKRPLTSVDEKVPVALIIASMFDRCTPFFHLDDSTIFTYHHYRPDLLFSSHLGHPSTQTSQALTRDWTRYLFGAQNPKRGLGIFLICLASTVP